jgi:hypothetical protein
MAIAANFRKFPQAMALQLVIQFGRPTWNTARPTTRHGRAVRAHITRTMKAIGLIIWPEAKAIPAWWKNGQKRARALAKEVKSDCSSTTRNTDSMNTTFCCGVYSVVRDSMLTLRAALSAEWLISRGMD